MGIVDTSYAAGQTVENGSLPLRLSIIIEWANTLLNGTPRAKVLFDILAQQWEAIARHDYPPSLSPDVCRFLDRFEKRAQILIVSGDNLRPEDQQAFENHVFDSFDLGIHVKAGLEYYPLKNFGASLANGDFLQISFVG